MSEYAVAKLTNWRWVMVFVNAWTGLWDRRAVSVWSSVQREDTQNPQFPAQGLKMSLVPQVFLFIAGEWCAVQP